MTIALLYLVLITQAVAQTAFHSPRPRVLIHAKAQISEKHSLTMHVVPTTNLLADSASPIVHLELGRTNWKHVDVAPAIGWAYHINQPIAAVRIHTKGKNNWSWTDLRVLPLAGPWLVASMVEYQGSWIAIGIEVEGSGSLTDPSTSNIGAGPNILFGGKPLRLDLSIQGRHIPYAGFKPELSTRVHMIF